MTQQTSLCLLAPHDTRRNDTEQGRQVPPTAVVRPTPEIGLANASPTIAITFTFSRSIASRSSVGSNRRPASVTTEPPTENIPMELNAPVRA